ncbi:hypothetical protein KFL_002350080 [Klebsormidium nitens]|uniref:Uncharacterized protein n=1 Tax=Klebsormidium nitens TaxID=105231 RepID=A0A1Y1I4L0_KLENI|nr:hypothetical protein KFL_002350080 [Klebsormidium nitens]|eukprot:GAQ85433.1 hypothetical protein KFL_002350080 [Klebsormidium nitens]
MGGSDSECESLESESLSEVEFASPSSSPRTTTMAGPAKTRREQLKDQMEDARLVYLNTLEAPRSAVSQLRSKKQEYLQLLEQERPDLENEIGRVKDLKEETWPAGESSPDAANETQPEESKETVDEDDTYEAEEGLDEEENEVEEWNEDESEEEEEENVPPPQDMSIMVNLISKKGRNGRPGKTKTVRVNEGDTMRALKEQIRMTYGVPLWRPNP